MKAFAELRHDLPASVVVFFVAVPLCLGIALASGAPLIAGLISGIVGGIVVGGISRSPLGVSGPAAGLTVIVLGAIQELGSFEAFLLAVVIAGLMQIALGIARAGVLGYFFPSSVIKGMLCGIGIIIVLKQIPHAFGHDTDPEGELSFLQPDGGTTLSALETMLHRIDPRAMLVAGLSLAILLVWDGLLAKRARFARVLPGPLIAVAFGILYQVLATRFAPGMALAPTHLVDVPVAQSPSELLALLTHPDWSRLSDGAVYLTAVTLAVVASLETLLSVEAVDKLDPFKRVTPTNRELAAQGWGNVVSGLLGGLPVTQVIVRSSANVQSGGRTKLSAIMHGALILLFVAVLPEALNLVPLAVLASVLIVVGFKLAKPALFKRMWALGRSQFVPFAVTVLGLVFTDLLTGIALGLGVAVVVILKRTYENSHFLHKEEHEDHGHVVTMRLAEEVTFLNKGAIRRELDRVPDGSRVVIDASAAVTLDHDVIEVIEDFESAAPSRGITVERIGRLEPRPGLRRAV